MWDVSCRLACLQLEIDALRAENDHLKRGAEIERLRANDVLIEMAKNQINISFARDMDDALMVQAICQNKVAFKRVGNDVVAAMQEILEAVCPYSP